MAPTKVLRDMGYTDITVHGFRSSFPNWAAERTATPGDVADPELEHTIRNKVAAAYRRTNYLAKRRELMDDWAAYFAT
jgi:integrase